MRFVVILKQIPDDSIKKEYQDVDQLNDSDKNVIKEALDLRDRYGGTVDVIGFGPLSAEDVMKETLTYGIDDAFLISDSQFADMDVSQVAKIVAAVIKKLGPYDLVLCGRQAIDGDSAHMASMTSCALEIPLIAYSDEITEMKDGSVFATCMGDQMAYKVEAKTPAMILSIREKNKNRFPSVPDIMKTYDGTYKTKILTNEDLNFSVTKRKVTQLRKYEVKSSKQQKLVMIGGKDEEEKAAQILQLLKQKSVIQEVYGDEFREKRRNRCCWRDSKERDHAADVGIDRGSRKTFEGKRSFIVSYSISENGNAPVDLGKIGNRLNAKYSDFDVRNYGYTKLSVLIDEEMDNFMLVQEDTNCYVEFKELTSRETIEEEVIHFVKKNGGSLDNLSAVTLELKDKHSGFNIKDYGYSRMSSFLRSIRCLTVNGNTVRLKKRREKGERR